MVDRNKMAKHMDDTDAVGRVAIRARSLPRSGAEKFRFRAARGLRA
jgi:hypothetical protein